MLSAPEGASCVSMCVRVRVNTGVFWWAHAASLQACSLFVFVNESRKPVFQWGDQKEKLKHRLKSWNWSHLTRRQSLSALRTLLSTFVFFFNNRAVGVTESHLKHPHKDRIRQSALWFRAGGDTWHTAKCWLNTPCYPQLSRNTICSLLLMDAKEHLNLPLLSIDSCPSGG